MDKTKTDRPSLALSSYASAAGFALGEMLLLTGKSEELLEHLREIHITARATIMCTEAESDTVTVRRAGVSLSVAALKAVQTWNADPQDPAALDDAMALLAEILEEMGVLRVIYPDEA
jgi:Iap family predicted aminopeptidase